jgi:hypothetical protein
VGRGINSFMVSTMLRSGSSLRVLTWAACGAMAATAILKTFLPAPHGLLAAWPACNGVTFCVCPGGIDWVLCATTVAEMVLLGASRGPAFLIYPLLLLLYLSKWVY